MQLIKRIDFSKKYKLSKPAVTKAVTRGAVATTGEGIDLRIIEDDPKTKDYIKRIKEKKSSDRESSREQPRIQAPQTQNKTYGMGGATKNDLDMKRIQATTAKIQLEIAQKMGTLILRDEVNKFSGRLSSVIVNHFFPLGGRVAPAIAAICKITDQAITQSIENEINKEVMRGLEEFKREAEAGIFEDDFEHNTGEVA